MKDAKLIAFVRKEMPPTEELLRRARIARLPEKCRESGATLEEICKKFQHIPTKDSTLTFPSASGKLQMMLLASGGGRSRVMREGICRIVHCHLRKRFREQGIQHTSTIV